MTGTKAVLIMNSFYIKNRKCLFLAAKGIDGPTEVFEGTRKWEVRARKETRKCGPGPSWPTLPWPMCGWPSYILCTDANVVFNVQACDLKMESCGQFEFATSSL